MAYKKSKFDLIAPFYDYMMKLFFLPLGGETCFRQKILEFGHVKSNHVVLDVGSGTGTFSFLASRYTTDGISIGMDISKQMLSVAAARAYNQKPCFVLGDSSNMPFCSNLFDRVFVTYVLHELPLESRKKTLQEIRRILKPEGLLIVTDLCIPQGKFKKLIFNILMMLEEKDAWDFVLRGIHCEVESMGFRIKREEFLIDDFVATVMATPLG